MSGTILTAKVHPATGQSSEQLAERLDEVDVRLRRQLPKIAEVAPLFPTMLSGTVTRYTAAADDAETKTVTTTTAIAAHKGDSQ